MRLGELTLFLLPYPKQNSANSLHSNEIDLNLLSEMGITPGLSSPRLRLGDSLRGKIGKTERKRPSLRAVAFMVVAGCRMKKMSEEWAGQRRVRDALSRKLEGMLEGKRGKRVSSGR